MLDDAKVKVAPPLPGVRRGWIIFGLMLLSIVILLGQLVIPVYSVMLVPPFHRLWVNVIMVLPFLWIPLFIVWYRSLAATAWLRFLTGFSMFMLCISCWAMGNIPTLIAMSTMTCTALSDTTYQCVYPHPIEKLQLTLMYERMDILPLMKISE